MGCNKCKEKQKLEKKLINKSYDDDKKIIFFIVFWVIMGLYGIYELIGNIYERL